jgi:hypothetical protein
MQLKLQEILYHLNVEGDMNFLKDLVRNQSVQNVIIAASKRHKCKQDVLKSWLCDWVIRYYKFDDGEYCEERFLEMARKYLGRKARKNNRSVIIE